MDFWNKNKIKRNTSDNLCWWGRMCSFLTGAGGEDT
jgi:hypothetical protein